MRVSSVTGPRGGVEGRRRRRTTKSNHRGQRADAGRAVNDTFEQVLSVAQAGALGGCHAAASQADRTMWFAVRRYGSWGRQQAPCSVGVSDGVGPPCSVGVSDGVGPPSPGSVGYVRRPGGREG